jgi:hypothetical protein
MKASEAIGKKVFYMRPQNFSIIKQVRKLENYNNTGRDMFLCYLENGAILNSIVLNVFETKEILLIED